MSPAHPDQASPLDLGDEEPFLLGPALNFMNKAFDLADDLGTSAAWEFRGFVIARLQSSRPEVLAPGRLDLADQDVAYRATLAPRGPR